MCRNMTQRIMNRFLAQQIPEAIWGKYFKGQKILGISEHEFLGRINAIMVCLTCAILGHTVPYCAILCHTVPYCAILCHTVPYCAILCHTVLHQQKNHLLQTDRHCVWTQEIRLEHPVRPAHPQRAPAEWLHPSPLGAIQPASCPPSAPGWAISHPNLPKNTKVSDQWGFALRISPGL